MFGILAGAFASATAPRWATRPPTLGVARWASARREGLTLAALGLLALALTLYLCEPGYMGPDARTQLQQARDFEFWDDHPVLMALLWHYLDRLAPGPLGMFVFTSSLSWAGLTALFLVLPGPLGWRALGLLGVGFFPPVFATLPIVLKDTIMQAALLLAVALVIPKARRWLLARLAASLAFFLLAIGVRHNAAAAVWPFFALLVLRLPTVARLRPWLGLGVGSLAGLALAFGMTRGVDRALAPLSHKTEFWQVLATYDLTGISLRAEEVVVDPDSPVFTGGMGLTEMEQLFRLEFGQTIYNCVPFDGQRCVPMFRHTEDPAELAALSRNWLSAIAEHPAAYLAHRWALTREMLTVNKPAKALYYLDGAPHGPLAAQYPPTERLLWLLTFLERHIWFVAYSPWVYVVVSLLLLPWTLVRYLRGAAPLPLILVLSGIAYLLSNLVGASSTTYRYSVWTILCTLLALFALAGEKRMLAPGSRTSARSRGSQPAGASLRAAT